MRDPVYIATIPEIAADLGSEKVFWPTSQWISGEGGAAKPARTIPREWDSPYISKKNGLHPDAPRAFHASEEQDA